MDADTTYEHDGTETIWISAGKYPGTGTSATGDYSVRSTEPSQFEGKFRLSPPKFFLFFFYTTAPFLQCLLVIDYYMLLHHS